VVLTSVVNSVSLGHISSGNMCVTGLRILYVKCVRSLQIGLVQVSVNSTSVDVLDWLSDDDMMLW